MAVTIGAVGGVGRQMLTNSDQPAAETGTLVVVMDADQSVGQQRHKLIDTWVNLTGIEVKIREIPSTATAAHSQLVAEAQSGGGDADVYSLDITWIAEFAQRKWIHPLDRSTVDEGAFLDTPLRAGQYAGELWALPFNTDAGLLFCNRRLLPGCDEATIQTWDDLVTLVNEMPEGSRPDAVFAGQFADYEGFTVNVLESILVEEQTALDSGVGLSVTDTTVGTLADLAARLDSRWGGSLGYAEPDTTEAFAAGDVAFMRNWPIAYRQLTAAEGDDAPRMEPDDIGVMRLPGPSVLGGQSLAIAGSSDQRRAAQDLIEFLTGPYSQVRLFQAGGFAPTRRIIYEDPWLQADFPYLTKLRDAVEGARLRPIRPHYERFSEAMRRIVRPYLIGEPDAELPTPDQLREDLNLALEGHRRE
jgi:multiple sugar transport system substrate-binding protein